jgi:hypothetical protein
MSIQIRTLPAFAIPSRTQIQLGHLTNAKRGRVAHGATATGAYFARVVYRRLYISTNPIPELPFLPARIAV